MMLFFKLTKRSSCSSSTKSHEDQTDCGSTSAQSNGKRAKLTKSILDKLKTKSNDPVSNLSLKYHGSYAASDSGLDFNDNPKSKPKAPSLSGRSSSAKVSFQMGTKDLLIDWFRSQGNEKKREILKELILSAKEDRSFKQEKSVQSVQSVQSEGGKSFERRNFERKSFEMNKSNDEVDNRMDNWTRVMDNKEYLAIRERNLMEFKRFMKLKNERESQENKTKEKERKSQMENQRILSRKIQGRNPSPEMITEEVEEMQIEERVTKTKASAIQQSKFQESFSSKSQGIFSSQGSFVKKIQGRKTPEKIIEGMKTEEIESQSQEVEKKSKQTIPKVLMISDPRPTNPLGFHGIWVGNFSPKLTIADIESIFGAYGKIIDIKYRRASKYIIIEYDNGIAPIKAISELFDSFQLYYTFDPTKPFQFRFAPSQSQLEGGQFDDLTVGLWAKTIKSIGECFMWRTKTGCNDSLREIGRCSLGTHLAINHSIDSYIQDLFFDGK